MFGMTPGRQGALGRSGAGGPLAMIAAIAGPSPTANADRNSLMKLSAASPQLSLRVRARQIFRTILGSLISWMDSRRRSQLL